MKRAVLWVCVVFLFAAVSGVMAEEEGHDKGMKHAKMAGHLMKAMMMQKMMQKELVATSDGGVVVLVGNKLMKYDKNLNLKAEAEIKIDKSEWKKMMKHCPMGRKGEAEAEEAEVGAEEPEASDEDAS